MTPAVGERLKDLATPASRLCVGIDPHPAILGAWGLADSPEGVQRFGAIVLEALEEAQVRIVKPQVALFERHGVKGMAVLSDLLQGARDRGLITIADAKRGDVGSTVAGYADAWLRPGSDFEADCVTAVAYQGVGSLEPLFEAAEEYHRTVFVLVATSNPEGWPLQSAQVSPSGVSVARHTLDGLIERQAVSSVPGIVGAVVGATVDQAALGIGDNTLASSALPILAPGYGFQGASLADLSGHFPKALSTVIPTVSRSVVSDGPDTVVAAIHRHLVQVPA